MDESFLHYIWKFQYFDKEELFTTCNKEVTVLNTGVLNSDAGADFQNARVLIDDIEWNGSVEIHINGKDWYQHKHDQDKSYDNVVLHVIWDGQKDSKRSDGTTIPTLKLKDRINLKLYERYQKLIGSTDRILCHSFLDDISELKILEAFDKVVVGRLQRKANEIMIRLRKNDMNWEETTYQLMAANFGFKKNKEPFTRLSESLPHKVLLKHADNPMQIEALLYGQAGFLNEKPADDYQAELQGEYNFLKRKYDLNKSLHRSTWKFLRLRPANFPTIRIAQFASIIHQYKNIFSLFYHENDVRVLERKLSVKPGAYWQKHYDFGKRSEKMSGNLGRSSIENIIINTCAPLFTAYSIEKDEQSYLDKAIAFLQSVKAENNNIVREWRKNNIEIKTAFDSQASIELLNNYCIKRRCLDCSIGVGILQKAR